jgi:NADPH-dependent 2,4-dienoyl-CoA reductase/sulfur reductase-like enzyme
VPKLKVDGNPVEVSVGTTVLDAARACGIAVPTLCSREGLGHHTSCMVCVVRDARSDRFLPSCTALAEAGMDIDASGKAVRDLRREALAMLAAEHAGDCEAPCRRACPAGMDIPAMLRAIRSGDYEKALRIAMERIPLPGVLGRICPAPCEKACRRSSVDEPVAVRLLRRFVADRDLGSGSPPVPKTRESTGRTVSVAGAGPAGLSAACFLLREGHAVRIVDAGEAPGGALRSAVSREVLPLAVLDAEVEVLGSMGAEFRQGVRLGEDVTLEALREESDAVVLAVGRQGPDFFAALGLGTDSRGATVDNRTLQSSLPDVFLAGDAVHPGRMAVRSIAQGRTAAASVSGFLAGEEVAGAPRRFGSRLGRLGEEEVRILRQEVEPASRAGAETGALGEEEAVGEAVRCLDCDCLKKDDCRLRDLVDEYGAGEKAGRRRLRRAIVPVLRTDALRFEAGKCILCGLCVRIAEKNGEPVAVGFAGRGSRARVAPPLGEPLGRALGKSAEECVRACPTGALTHRREGARE